MNMIRDRGAKKWQGMFLPEHREQLAALWEEEQKEARPILDEQQIERIQVVLTNALATRAPIQCHIYEEGHLQTYQGRIRRIDTMTQRLELQAETGYHAIPMGDIVEVEMEETY